MKIIDCPFIDQRQKYPTGCESVSAVMLLRYYGFELTPEEFIDLHLPKDSAPQRMGDRWYGADPNHFYLGNPYTDDGWGCFAPAVCDGINSFLKSSEHEKYTAVAIYESSIETLCSEYISKDDPVIIFATMGMEAPRESLKWTIPETGSVYTWKTPMHCLLLTGFSDREYIFNDPLCMKNMSYSKEKAEFSYVNMGSQAVVLKKQ